MNDEEKNELNSPEVEPTADQPLPKAQVEQPPLLTFEDINYLHRLTNADIAVARRLGAPDGHAHQLFRAKVLDKLSRIRVSLQPGQ